jgi:hypothetical protein
MIGRNKRGIRRASTRVRLAVAAAVLVGGGAAGVVAVAANHNGPVNAASAGYYTHTLSETHAMSDAMNWWSKSPQTSLGLISKMTPMRTVSMMPFHNHTIALQRGTVITATRDAFVIKSSNRQIELWFVNHGTQFLNVGSSSMGMTAMTGGTMAMPSHMKMNTKTKTLAKGDLVFIFGERVHGELIAQLVLFVAPTKVTTTPTPTATPSMTATATATPTATPTATGTATATPSTTSTTPNTTINGTPAVSGTHS